MADDAASKEIAVSFNTYDVSVSLLTDNLTEVASGTVPFSDGKVENVSISVTLNDLIWPDLLIFNLPGAWETGTKSYPVKVTTNDGIESYMSCNFVLVDGKIALSLKEVRLPFNPHCLQLNCPSIVFKPTIKITVTDDTGTEREHVYEIKSYLPFLDNTPVVLNYQ